MGDQDGLLSSSSRVKGTAIVKPILVGNTSRYFGKKREEDGHTHSWTVYVKPFHNEDISVWVKKVQFKLHDSYPNPQRIISEPPFQVTESGWGEFEIGIKIFFHDASEKPVSTFHLLKLFHTDVSGIIYKKHVVSEMYDEIIFNEPTVTMHQLLASQGRISSLARQDAANDYGEQEEQMQERIAIAQRKIEMEVADLRSRIQHRKALIPQLKVAISQLPKAPTVSTGPLSAPVHVPASPASQGTASNASST